MGMLPLEPLKTDEERIAEMDAANESAGVGPATPEQAPQGSVSEQDPGEVAAMMIKEFAPRYKKAIKDLTTGDVRRLALALATWPLENEQVLECNLALQNAFAMGDRLVQAKMLLIGDYLVDRETRQEQVKKTLAEQNAESAMIPEGQ